MWIPEIPRTLFNISRYSELKKGCVAFLILKVHSLGEDLGEA
jgi:hypothetical protein